MLCRSVYCAFSSNQLTSCQILILQPENHRLYSRMLFHAAPEKTFLLEMKATSLCWTNYSSDKCERTIPPSQTRTHAHTQVHTHATQQRVWTVIIDSRLLLCDFQSFWNPTMKSCCCGSYMAGMWNYLLLRNRCDMMRESRPRRKLFVSSQISITI